MNDLSGKQFTKLTVRTRVVQSANEPKSKHTKWLCLCSCGNPNPLEVFTTNLQAGKTTSCGECDEYDLSHFIAPLPLPPEHVRAGICELYQKSNSKHRTRHTYGTIAHEFDLEKSQVRRVVREADPSDCILPSHREEHDPANLNQAATRFREEFRSRADEILRRGANQDQALAVKAFEQTIPQWNEAMLRSEGGLRATDYSEERSGRCSAFVAPCFSDFVADVQLAATRSLNGAQLRHFNEFYRDKCIAMEAVPEGKEDVDGAVRASVGRKLIEHGIFPNDVYFTGRDLRSTAYSDNRRGR